MKKVNYHKNKKYPTVKDMLVYIKNNHIPMDAEILVEHLDDNYLKKWAHYISEDDIHGLPEILLPAHNGFGMAMGGKKFVIWMHC
jgi:hypothetical protein